MKVENRLLFPLLCALCIAGCSREKIDRVEWPAMGTIAAVQTRGEGVKYISGVREIVQLFFGMVESALNAHDGNSEISRLAGLPDDEVLRVTTQPRCFAAAFSLMEASGGAFNPRWRGPGTLDLGAIAKGAAVDWAALNVWNGEDILIDLGGNLKSVRGNWRTGVADPNGGGFAAVVDLREGEALATSATYYRGSHIYDGRTGLAVSNGVASVTVLCRSAMWADGLSTTLFILGPEAGRAFVEEKCPLFMPDCYALSDGKYAAVLWILSDGRQVKLDPDSRFSAR